MPGVNLHSHDSSIIHDYLPSRDPSYSTITYQYAPTMCDEFLLLSQILRWILMAT